MISIKKKNSSAEKRKMIIGIRGQDDLIYYPDSDAGNPKLKEKGFGEEAHGHNSHRFRFPGQRQWTDFLPNGDFSEADT